MNTMTTIPTGEKMSVKQSIRYDVVGRAALERGGGHQSHYLKLLYKGDGTPWWICNASLSLAVSPEMYDAATPGTHVTITIESAGE
jgi:hypothetical protein